MKNPILSYETKDIGKRVACTKTQHTWRVFLCDRFFKLTLKHSRLTNKKTILLQGQPVHIEQGLRNMDFLLKDTPTPIRIRQAGSHFELSLEQQVLRPTDPRADF
jgi:hypothetical protein